MRHRFLIKNENGIALVMVLVLSAISLAIMSVLIFMITSGTQISGMGKRYLTALESAYGTQETATDFINLGGVFNAGAFCANFTNTNAACLTAKRTNQTTAANWGACANFANATSTIINPADTTTYDMSFECGNYRSYVKIIDTTHGNTQVHTGLMKGSVISAQTDVGPPPVPWGYSFEILSVNLTNPNDTAKVSFVYAY